jgi:hypothetical protein
MTYIFLIPLILLHLLIDCYAFINIREGDGNFGFGWVFFNLIVLMTINSIFLTIAICQHYT